LDVGNPKQDNISLITYVHGAEDRTPSTQSNWTQISLAGRVRSSWQIMALSAVAALLIVTIALMVWLKIARSEDPVITTPAPTTETVVETAPTSEPVSTALDPSPEADAEAAPIPEDALAQDPNANAADPQEYQGVEDALNAPAGEAANE